MGIIKNKFLEDNFYLLLGTGVLSVSGFLFHFFMGRSLGPEGYGVLASLMAIIALLGISATTIQLTISKFVASLNAKKATGEINYLYSVTNKKLNKIFFFVFVVFLVVGLFLVKFLHIPYFLFSLSFLSILIIPILASSRGFLQGLQNFRSYGVSLGLEGLSKLVFGVFFVVIGWKVGGAVLGVILSYLLAMLYCDKIVKKRVDGDKKIFTDKEIYHYTLPTFFTVLFFTAFYSIDLLLVKHFFSAIDAGKYAVVSLIGKIVFFASFSVIQVMYPKVVELSGDTRAHKKILYKSLLIILIMVTPILLVYQFFGDYVINLLFGESYLSVVPLIVPYGLFMLFVSISKMFSLYLLSFKKYSFLYIFSLFLLLEVGLIFLFHESLAQIVNLLMVLSLLFTLLTTFLVVRFKEK